MKAISAFDSWATVLIIFILVLLQMGSNTNIQIKVNEKRKTNTCCYQKPAGAALSVECQALGHEAMCLNLPVVPEETLGSHFSVKV